MANRSDDVDDPYANDYADDDMFTQRERYSGERRSQRPRVVSDFVRRAIENTVGSVTNTGSISRDALNYLLQQGDRGKKEIVRIVAHEVGEFLKNVDLSSEVLKVLSNIQVEMNASIRFKPTKEGSVKPEISSEVSVREPRDPREPRDARESREPRDGRDPKDPRDRDPRDPTPSEPPGAVDDPGEELPESE